jgi:hypothetical protein
VNRQFTVLCQKLELFGGQLLAVDGSKFAAVNARDQNFNAAKLQDLIARADARLAEYLPATGRRRCGRTGRECAHESRTGGEDCGVAGEAGLARRTAGAVAGRREKQVSVTDPDTRKMPTAHGMLVGYNAQMAVDAKHKLIAADDVTNEVTDYKQLANVALAAKANLELKQAEVVADAGYYNAAEVSRCVEAGLTP